MQNQEYCLLEDSSEHKEIPVEELSGDEGMEKTVMVTFTNHPKANLFETATTVVKSIVGSGIISLPYTVSVMGWALSIILFSVVGLANQHTISILLKAKNLARHSTYNSIAYSIFKSKYCTFFLSFLNMFGNIGFVVAMLSILKSTLRKLLLQLIGSDSNAQDMFFTSETFIAIIVSIFLAPTVLLERVQSLRYLSVIGVFAIVLAIVSLFIIFFVEMGKRQWQNSFTMMAFPSDSLGVVSVFPNIMFALVFQSNFFSIYKGLKESTDHRVKVATGAGIGFSTALYIILGIIGYCLYGKQRGYVDANFLLQTNRQQTNTILYVGLYLGFLVCDLFAIPITFMVARNNLIVIIKLLKTSAPIKRLQKKQYSAIQQIGSFTEGQSKEAIKRKAKIRFYIYTLSLYAIYVLITILVTSLAAVFNFVGAIASSAISFILPYTFYVMLVIRKKKPRGIHYFLSLTGIMVFVPLGILSVISLYI